MRLYINIDHVATVRQARRTDEPDPVRAAVLAELGGADGITIHLREDRRHINDRDVRLLAETVRTGINFELAAADPVVDIAVALAPMQATLVPEKREEVTTEGGLNLASAPVRDAVGASLRRLEAAGTRTSLFIDPDAGALDHSARPRRQRRRTPHGGVRQRHRRQRRRRPNSPGWPTRPPMATPSDWRSTPVTASPTRTCPRSPPCRTSRSSTLATAWSRARCWWGWSGRCGR